jgi:hypothetical protein
VRVPLLDAGPKSVDTPSLPASSSDLPALSPYNRESPVIPPSSRWTSETTGSSSGFSEAGPSQVRLDSHASIPSSRVTGAIEVPRSEMDHSPPSMSGSTDVRQSESITEPCLAVVGHGRGPDNSCPRKRPSFNYGPKVVTCNHCKGT